MSEIYAGFIFLSGLFLIVICVLVYVLRLQHLKAKRIEKVTEDIDRIILSTTDARSLLARLSEKLQGIFHLKQAFIVLEYSDGSKYISGGTHGHDRLPRSDIQYITKYLKASEGRIVRTDSVPTDLRRVLTSHGIEELVPLRQGSEIVGYVCLEHKKGDHLHGSDEKLLAQITNLISVALQNALSLQELKELNQSLQQRIQVSTHELRSSNAQLKHVDEVKDEFMSMASHQLRTPLTSVKGYLSMVLEGDAGEITPQQRKLLTEAFDSSERMVRLIADFLNVSRLQTGKFMIEKSDFEFKKLVKQEADNLRLLAEGHELKIELDMPDEELIVHADSAKVREVVMNFIDNAIYYSRPGTTMKVVAKRTGDHIEFTVHDTGIGVPKEEQARLFNKFFRATNARKQRPDGTGVGLYLAKKIITAHKGTILFRSTEGKGSTFGFRLPLKKPTK